ncbi:MAG: glycosyltransferase family 4 protein [Proteobacteria bacterium]|nr:glycosyltransferase family 4 protein [Pseudomonadota bacterium]
MKIWVVTQYFTPEYGPAQTRIYDFAKAWLKDGHDVDIFAPTPHHHPQKKMKKSYYRGVPSVFKEKYDGISVYRHKVAPIRNKNFSKTMKVQLSFALKILRHLIKSEHNASKPDVIIATSPSLLCCLSAYLLAKRFNAKFILEIRNIIPQAYINSRLIKFDSFHAKVLNSISNYLYQNADSIVVLSVRMAKRLVTLGASKDKIFLVHDGVSDDFLIKADRSKNSLQATKIRNNLQIHPMTKIVMFLGVFSSKIGLGQILEAAKMLLSRNDIIFLMVGDGEDKPRLVNMAKGMPNVKFLGTVDPDVSLGYYACADLVLVPYRDSNEIATHIPHKFFETIATKTPGIFCLTGEAQTIIEESDVGVVVPPNKPEELAKSIIATFENYERAKLKANKGPILLEERFKHSTSARTYITIAKKVLGINYHDDKSEQES